MTNRKLWPIIALALCSACQPLQPSPGSRAAYDAHFQNWMQKLDAESRAHRNRTASALDIGMTETEVTASPWGPPAETNYTTTAGQRRVQWVYPGDGYLYFADGRLVAIQSNRP